MRNFLEYTDEVLTKSFERHLYHVEQKEGEYRSDKDNRYKQQNELQGPSKLRSILRESRKNSKKLPVISGRQRLLCFG